MKADCRKCKDVMKIYTAEDMYRTLVICGVNPIEARTAVIADAKAGDAHAKP